MTLLQYNFQKIQLPFNVMKPGVVYAITNQSPGKAIFMQVLAAPNNAVM
jgi:hypothetical protein